MSRCHGKRMKKILVHLSEIYLTKKVAFLVKMVFHALSEITDNACKSYRTKLQNVLSAPGIDLIEKSLLEQYLLNMPIAQDGYAALQMKVLGK